jgi:hypothetical protein
MELTSDQRQIEVSKRPHYTFAHSLLPDLFFAAPDKFITQLLSLDQNEVIQIIWSSVCEGFQFDPSEGSKVIDVDSFSHNGGGLVLITMPEAIYSPEAIAVCLSLEEDNVTARYFVLELGSDEKFLVCEWTPEQHINYGINALREVSISGFGDAVTRVLNNELQPKYVSNKEATGKQHLN